jgi:hypothetical protein
MSADRDRGTFIPTKMDLRLRVAARIPIGAYDVRHRLNRGGDRTLNAALHTITKSRQRYHQRRGGCSPTTSTCAPATATGSAHPIPTHDDPPP